MRDARAVLDLATKGVPAGARVAVDAVGSQGWNVLAGDTATPVAVLREPALDHNVAVMAEYCRRAGVALAPHGKTTLSAAIVERQLAAGAWGMTAATVQQASLLAGFGARRILLANEVVDPHALAWLAAGMQDDEAPEVCWYVDSEQGLRLAEQAMAGRAGRARLLVELGYPSGRTGVRDDAEAMRLARAVSASEVVGLAGVSGYEGTIGTGRDTETMARVESFVGRIGAVFEQCRSEGLLDQGRPAIVSAGGSVYFDVVARLLGPLASADSTVVLRSGCYVTHDHGLYQAATPANGDTWPLAPFEPALEVWTRVLSRPEPGLVLLDAGRRDVSFDAGLPVVLRAVGSGGQGVDVAGAVVTALSDQHAFASVPPGTGLAPGDLVGLGVSHPCTTFDRWPQLLLVDDGYRVTGVAQTAF